MKKFLAALTALTAITAALAGCSGNNSSSSSSAESTSGSQEQQTATRTAKDITSAVFECVEWVAAEEITNAENAETMLGLDLDLLEDYSIFVPMMSVHLDELIVVKPKSGSEEEVESQLNTHFEYIKDGAAFYPDQEIAAAGAVMGQTDDGFYYIIVHQIGSEIADVIKDYQPGDELPKLEIPEVVVTGEYPTAEMEQ